MNDSSQRRTEMAKHPMQNLRLVELCKSVMMKHIGERMLGAGVSNSNSNLTVVQQRNLGSVMGKGSKEYCVQVLPVLEKQIHGGPFSRTGEILLCQWKDGCFKDRHTGLLKTNVVLSEVEEGEMIRKHLENIAHTMIPGVLKNNVEHMKLVGILNFDGPPEYDEYVYKAVIKTDVAQNIKAEQIDFEGNSCNWYKWDHIPYDEMPADDKFWYPQVLWGDAKIKGSFVFGGATEKQLKAYDLRAVKEFR